MAESRLDNISIASPCTADWNQMSGDERRRFCSQCKLHVHNLSGMTRAQATALLQRSGEGRVCVRFFRRTDGTVLTRDCPVGLRQRLRLAAARSAALCVALWSSAVACFRPGTTATSAPPEPAPRQRPLQGEVSVGAHEMGDVAIGKVAPPKTPEVIKAPPGKQ